jgi:hypothetical protein
MNYKDALMDYINLYKKRMITFEECIIKGAEILTELKRYYNSVYFHGMMKNPKVMNQARVYFLTELIKALVENI